MVVVQKVMKSTKGHQPECAAFIKNAYFVELPHEEPQRADVRQGHRFCLPLPVCGIHFERGGELELRYLNGEIHWILEHCVDHSQAFSSWPARSDSSSLRASRSEASECRKQSCNANCRRIKPSEISRGKPSNNLILKFPIYPFQQNNFASDNFSLDYLKKRLP